MKRGYKIFVFSFIFILVLCTVDKSVYAKDKPNVLFINSYNTDFENFSNQVMGIKSGFNNNVNLQIEYLEHKIFENEESEKNIYESIKYKMEKITKFDAIIVYGNGSLQFALKYRDSLFKDVPIVFFGVRDEKLAEKALGFAQVTGIMRKESIDSNIELIQKLHKRVKNIIILDKFTNPDISEEMINRTIEKYDNYNFKIIDSKEMYIDEFEEYLRTLNGESAILSLYPTLFKNNFEVTEGEAYEIIYNNTKYVPVYSSCEHGVGYGSIGGKVISQYSNAEKAGEITVSMLAGEEPKKLFIPGDNANTYLFDYGMINKFNIRKYNLPENSQIISKPISTVIENKQIFIAFIVLTLGLTLILMAFVGYIILSRKHKKELLKAIKLSEEANRSKNYFMNNISHELKTPITLITSAVQLINLKAKNNQENLYSEINSNIKVINTNCYRLMRLINNTLDMMKAESNSLTLRLENLNIVELVEDTVLSVVPYANAKNLEVVFDTEDEEIFMAVDKEKIQRVVLNILSNSIKFSESEGTISVYLEINNSNVQLTINDEGIGIDKENLEKIFDKFVQIDLSLTRQNEGSGIGLSIVKTFIELHDGTVSVQSTMNEGTSFIISLPIKLFDEDDNNNNSYEEDTITNKTILELSDIYF